MDRVLPTSDFDLICLCPLRCGELWRVLMRECACVCVREFTSVFASMLAVFSIRWRTTSRWPFCDAAMKPVKPSWIGRKGSLEDVSG